jgi:hypothetical protein
MEKPGLVFAAIMAYFLLFGISCVAPRNPSNSERLFKVDSTKIAEFVKHAFRGPGPVNPSMIPPQENFVIAVGIKDGPCKANAGDIIYVAYRMDSSGKFWDCILRAENGRITKILKINVENIESPNAMIDYLLEPNCK